MTIEVGQTIPDVPLMTMKNGTPEAVSSTEVFKDKTVVLFAVPGAFTPTCSANHLPGFVENAAAFKQAGVDEIACISVNDAFVMDAWGKAQSADDNILMLADGNAKFAEAVGLTLDASGFGMGTRSQRYALIAKDGKVSDLFIEAPGAFEISSANHVLQFIKKEVA